MDQICTEVSLVSFFSDAVQETKLVVGRFFYPRMFVEQSKICNIGRNRNY
jgi:hypothetical protein